MLRFSNKKSHNCSSALVAFVFLRYNSGLIGENMIKPNTLCMIRGVPHERIGSEFNGNVVTVTRYKDKHEDGSTLYWIEPVLIDSAGRHFTGCREQWLFPFTDPDALGLNTANKEREAA